MTKIQTTIELITVKESLDQVLDRLDSAIFLVTRVESYFNIHDVRITTETTLWLFSDKVIYVYEEE